jgi:hypothetical protein
MADNPRSLLVEGASGDLSDLLLELKGQRSKPLASSDALLHRFHADQ